MVASLRTLLTPQVFNSQLFALRGHEITLLNPEETKGRVLLRCLHCSNEFESTPAKALRTDKNRSMCACTRKRTGPKEQTVSDWQDKLDDYYGWPEYVLLDEKYESNSATTKLYSFIHVDCGTEFKTLLSSLLASPEKGKRCPCQQARPSATPENYRKELAAKHGDDYELLEWSGPSKYARHLHRHTACRHEFVQHRSTMLSRDFCPSCDGSKGEKKAYVTLEQVQKNLNAIHGDEYTAVEIERRKVVYSDGNSNPTLYAVHIRHSCGHVFRANKNTFTEGSRLGRCPTCFGTSRQSYDVVYEGKSFRVRGYEEIALQELLEIYDATEIMSQKEVGFPVIYYKHKGPRKYYPDFYIPATNTIVEVKSTATAGLIETHNHIFGDHWPQLQAKAKQCLRYGYNFELMLYIGVDNKLVTAKMPDNWMYLTKYKIAEIMNIRIKRTRKSRGG